MAFHTHTLKLPRPTKRFRVAFITISVLAATGFLISCLLGSCHVAERSDGNVRIGTIVRLSQLLNVHSDALAFIRVRDTTYDNVLGSPHTKYVWLDASHQWVFFVTEAKREEMHRCVLHVVDTLSGTSHSVKSDVSFGSDLTTTPNARPSYSDYVVSFDGKMLTLVNRGSSLWTVDLNAGTIARAPYQTP